MVESDTIILTRPYIFTDNNALCTSYKCTRYSPYKIFCVVRSYIYAHSMLYRCYLQTVTRCFVRTDQSASYYTFAHLFSQSASYYNSALLTVGSSANQ